MQHFTLLIFISVFIQSQVWAKDPLVLSWMEKPAYKKLITSLEKSKTFSSRQKALSHIKAWIKSEQKTLQPQVMHNSKAETEFQSLALTEELLSGIPDPRFNPSEDTQARCPAFKQRILYAVTFKGAGPEEAQAGIESQEALKILDLVCRKK